MDSGDADARAHLGTCVARWGRRRGARRTQRPLPAWPGRLSDWQQPPAVPAAHALRTTAAERYRLVNAGELHASGAIGAQALA